MEKQIEKSEERLKQLFTGVIIVAGIGLLAFLLFYAPDRKGGMDNDLAMPASDKKEEAKLPKVDMAKIEEVEFFSDEGRTHVPHGTRVMYKTVPPTSGFHYDKWLSPAVYEDKDAIPELAVHSLEHGNVIIYFDREKLEKSDIETLTNFPKKYSGQWDGVVLVARSGMEQPLVLTAWRSLLRLKGYDEKKVSAFLEAFRGRGPEHPIR
jgi:hypothetical protein